MYAQTTNRPAFFAVFFFFFLILIYFNFFYFFGDSCKFLHAREDYQQGWQLDRDWEIGTKGKTLVGKAVTSANRSVPTGAEDEEDDASLESIPFACIICKKLYTNPIVTTGRTLSV
jgi:RING finger protein 113A